MEVILELPKDIDKLCRTCMNLIDNDDGTSNFVIRDNKQTELCAMLRTVTSLRVTSQDGLPKCLCSTCTDHLRMAYAFILQCTQVNESFKELFENAASVNVEAPSITQLKNVKPISGKCLENVYSCKVCPKSFKTYYELSAHSITHNLTKTLTDRFKEASQSKNHKVEGITEEVQEQMALIEEYRNSLQTTTIENSNKEMEIEKNKYFKCKNCDNVFESIGDFNLHFLEGCERNSKAQCKEAVCNLCGNEFKDFSSLSLHFLNHIFAYKMSKGDLVCDFFFCDYCGQLFESEASLNSHYLNQHGHSPTWQCFQCLESFDRERDLLSHSDVHKHVLEGDYESNEEINCILCSEKFNSTSDLYKHSVTHLMKRYSCRKCSVCFCTQNSFFTHVQIHSGDKHFCSLCGKYLSTNSALKSHIEGVHSVELQHCCSICGKRFATFTRLKTHSKIHTNDKKYICTYCGYSSHKSGDLVMHTRIHTSERPYKCTFANCSMSFKTSSHLCHHVRRHLQIKKYKCSICLTKFSTNHGLKIHQMQHTGEKPHPCIVCKRTFRRKYHLKVHMKQHSRT